MSAPSRSRSLLIAAVLMLAGTPALAQTAQQRRVIAPGDWIRVRQIEGEVVRVHHDSLILARGGRAADTLALPRNDLAGLEVSTGQRRNTRKGMTLGFLGGGAVGATLVVATYDRSDWFGPGEMAVGGLVLGGVAGLVLGGVIGASTRTRVWQSAELPVRFGVGPAGRGRTAALVTVAF